MKNKKLKNFKKKIKKKKLKTYFKLFFFLIPHFIKATSNRQESAKVTDFDPISVHSFRHLPLLWALGGCQLPLWCKNMPFGKYKAPWRALLNYPKTFSSCTFIMRRKDNQGERYALKDQRSRSEVMVDWLRCGFKRTSAQSRKVVFFITSCIIQRNDL